MSQRLGDVFASIGAVLVIAGLVLLMVHYFVWLKAGVWHSMHIRTVFDAMKVSTPQTADTILDLPLWVAMFTVGLVFIWVAAELYEQVARSLRVKTKA